MPTQRKSYYRPAPKKQGKRALESKAKATVAVEHPFHPRLFNRKPDPLNIGVTVMFNEKQIEAFEKLAEERGWSRSHAIREMAVKGLEMMQDA